MRILVLVCIQYALVSCLQSALFPVVLQSVQAYLGTSNAKMASLVSLYDVVQVVASLPCASASQRFGNLRTLSIGAVTSFCGAALFGLSTGFGGLVLAQLLMGIGASVVTVLVPHVMTLIAESPHQASAFLARTYASASIGVVVGYILSAVVGPEQWRLLFLLNAAGVVPIFCFLWRLDEPVPNHSIDSTVPDDQRKGVDVKDAAPELTNVTCTEEASNEPFAQEDSKPQNEVAELVFASDIRHALRSMQKVSLNRTVLLTVLSQSSISFGLAALIAFIPKYISETLGESQSLTSVLMATTVPATAAGVLISGHVAQKYRLTAYQLSQLVFACCAGSLILSAMFQTTQVALFTILLIVDMMLVFGSMVPSVMIFPQILTRELVPFANALSNTSIRLLGSVSGPLVLGLLLDKYESSGTGAVQMCYTSVSMFSMGLALVFAALLLQSFSPLQT